MALLKHNPLTFKNLNPEGHESKKKQHLKQTENRATVNGLARRLHKYQIMRSTLHFS